MDWRLPALVLTIAAVGLAGLAVSRPLVLINGLVPKGTYQREEGVAYGPGPRHRLDVYRPAGAATAAPGASRPLVIFFYGGSWNRGERGDYRFVGEALASRGIVTVIADYRLYPEVRYPDFLQDCAAATAWALSEAGRLGADPARVYVMGHSAGAYNAAMVALDGRLLGATQRSPASLAGWIGLAGPYDFLPITNPDARPVFFHPDYPKGSQPIELAASQPARVFLGAAVDDTLVNPKRNTLQMAQRLQAAGARVTVKTYERVNHMSLAGAMALPLNWLAPVADDVAAFIHVPVTGAQSNPAPVAHLRDPD